jgi:hypothetical protein
MVVSKSLIYESFPRPNLHAKTHHTLGIDTVPLAADQDLVI